ncbi:MAG: T9SS type A sorting domain-containing protein, partial [Bacteroidetes bacterium]|nr:T9SS type A sorting domain-containing protein [Bacteroidota bacterium]
DDVYLCGYFTETVDFDPGANTLMATAEGEEDLFVQKLDPQGNMIWTKTMGGTGRDFYEDIVVDDANQVYLCGYSNGAFDADPGQDTLWLEISGGYDFFVQKLDANGNLRWAHNFQGGIFGYEYARGLALDASANLYITGRFADEVDFDPGPGKREIEALGGEDVFVQKLDSAGNFIYAKAIESTGSSDIGEGLVVDAQENVYLTGGFQGMIDLNPGPDSFWVDTRGQMDIFVLKLKPCNHSTITLTESACDSYTAPDGQIFTETGVYTSLISNAVGCDSIITIDLTVNDIDPTIQVNDSTLTAQATGFSYQWLNCDNNYAMVPGATSQSFTPSHAGNYAVELSNNGCVDTSLCEFTNGTMTSIARWEEAKIQIFPNPNNGIFTIDLGKIYPHIQVKVTNILGQVVQEGERTNIKSFEWELPNEKGIYWISFFNQHGMQKSLMIVKQSF